MEREKRIKRILYLHNQYKISGGEQSLLNLWENIDRKKYILHLVIPQEGMLSRKAKQIGLNVEYMAVPKLCFKNWLKILRTAFLLGRYCKNNRIDIIHSYSPRNNMIATLLGKLMRISVVWHERNLIFGKEVDISRRFVFLPDQVICNSRAIAERFRIKGRIPSKVKVVLNGVDLNQYSPGKVVPDIVQKYNRNEKKVVGLISNLGKRKRPEYLLDACPNILKRCPNTVFLVVGGEFGEEDKGRKQELVEKAKNLGIGDQVKFTGFLTNVFDIVHLFDVGVAVTEKEACSRAILEIMAAGKPVVAFNSGGNSELIGHEVTGVLVQFGDILGFANSVADLLEDGEKGKIMGRNARDRVERLFDVRINARKTEAIYSELTG